MKKRFRYTIKTICFVIFFYLSCLFVSLFVRDVDTSYTRVLFNEFYRQDNIDILFCGASHVSHGVSPETIGNKIGKKAFNTGTPSQRLDGTYAIIQEAVSRYDIKEVWLEMDFAVIQGSIGFSESIPGKHIFLVYNYLKNPLIKISYMLKSTSPKYYINTMCPIGIETLVEMNPLKMVRRAYRKAKLLFKNDDYIGKGHSYGGKGIVYDEKEIKSGTFTSEPEEPIIILEDNPTLSEYIGKIIKICEENNIKLHFYCQPQTDFYLCIKQNYDEYRNYINKMIHPYKLIDFNLLPPSVYDPPTEEFWDDNHLNEKGVHHFTDIFCDYYTGTIKDSDFAESFKDKLLKQESRILGTVEEDKGNGSLKISPVLNHGNPSLISYKFTFEGNELPYTQDDDGNAIISYPKNSHGNINIQSFYNGSKFTDTDRFFLND